MIFTNEFSPHHDEQWTLKKSLTKYFRSVCVLNLMFYSLNCVLMMMIHSHLTHFKRKCRLCYSLWIFGTFTQLFILKKIGLDVQTFKNRKVWNISKTWKWFTLQSISFGSSWMIMKICVHFHANFIFDPTPWHVHHFDRHFVKFTSLV